MPPKRSRKNKNNNKNTGENSRLSPVSEGSGSNSSAGISPELIAARRAANLARSREVLESAVVRSVKILDVRLSGELGDTKKGKKTVFGNQSESLRAAAAASSMATNQENATASELDLPSSSSASALLSRGMRESAVRQFILDQNGFLVSPAANTLSRKNWACHGIYPPRLVTTPMIYAIMKEITKREGTYVVNALNSLLGRASDPNPTYTTRIQSYVANYLSIRMGMTSAQEALGPIMAQYRLREAARQPITITFKYGKQSPSQVQLTAEALSKDTRAIQENGLSAEGQLFLTPKYLARFSAAYAPNLTPHTEEVVRYFGQHKRFVETREQWCCWVAAPLIRPPDTDVVSHTLEDEHLWEFGNGQGRGCYGLLSRPLGEIKNPAIDLYTAGGCLAPSARMANQLHGSTDLGAGGAYVSFDRRIHPNFGTFIQCPQESKLAVFLLCCFTNWSFDRDPTDPVYSLTLAQKQEMYRGKTFAVRLTLPKRDVGFEKGAATSAYVQSLFMGNGSYAPIAPMFSMYFQENQPVYSEVLKHLANELMMYFELEENDAFNNAVERFVHTRTQDALRRYYGRLLMSNFLYANDPDKLTEAIKRAFKTRPKYNRDPLSNTLSDELASPEEAYTYLMFMRKLPRSDVEPPPATVNTRGSLVDVCSFLQSSVREITAYMGETNYKGAQQVKFTTIQTPIMIQFVTTCSNIAQNMTPANIEAQIRAFYAFIENLLHEEEALELLQVLFTAVVIPESKKFASADDAGANNNGNAGRAKSTVSKRVKINAASRLLDIISLVQRQWVDRARIHTPGEGEPEPLGHEITAAELAEAQGLIASGDINIGHPVVPSILVVPRGSRDLSTAVIQSGPAFPDRKMLWKSVLAFLNTLPGMSPITGSRQLQDAIKSFVGRNSKTLPSALVRTISLGTILDIRLNASKWDIYNTLSGAVIATYDTEAEAEMHVSTGQIPHKFATSSDSSSPSSSSASGAAAASSSSSLSSPAFSRPVLPPGAAIIPVPGDGHCVIHSLRFQLPLQLSAAQVARGAPQGNGWAYLHPPGSAAEMDARGMAFRVALYTRFIANLDEGPAIGGWNTFKSRLRVEDFPNKASLTKAAYRAIFETNNYYLTDAELWAIAQWLQITIVAFNNGVTQIYPPDGNVNLGPAQIPPQSSTVLYVTISGNHAQGVRSAGYRFPGEPAGAAAAASPFGAFSPGSGSAASAFGPPPPGSGSAALSRASKQAPFAAPGATTAWGPSASSSTPASGSPSSFSGFPSARSSSPINWGKQKSSSSVFNVPTTTRPFGSTVTPFTSQFTSFQQAAAAAAPRVISYTKKPSGGGGGGNNWEVTLSNGTKVTVSMKEDDDDDGYTKDDLDKMIQNNTPFIYKGGRSKTSKCSKRNGTRHTKQSKRMGRLLSRKLKRGHLHRSHRRPRPASKAAQRSTQRRR
jgi:hypothetical protein